MKNSFYLALLAGVFVASIPSVNAEAMTPEETVAFILFGVKAGESVTDSSGAQWSVETTRSDPLMLSVINSKFPLENYPVIDVHVEQSTKCEYSVVLRVDDLLGGLKSSAGKFNFAKLETAEYLRRDAYRLGGIEVSCKPGCVRGFEEFNRLKLSPFFLPSMAETINLEETQAEMTAAVQGFKADICKTR